MKILYLTTGCFDKGGISRYSRYQIRAIRELFGKENIKVLSLLGPDEDSFEEEIKTTWHGKGSNSSSKINMIRWALKIAISWKPTFIHAAHINLSSLAHTIAKLINAKSILNTYGHEIWSGLSLSKRWGLKNCHFVISDCHYTANYLEEKKLRPKNTTKVIWDCADLNRFIPGKIPVSMLHKYDLPSPEDYFVIMSLGRISEGARHKGYERLVEVFKIVSKKVKAARLVFIGGGDFLDPLKKITLENGLRDKAYFTGRITEDELTLVYRCASIFSLVSDRGKGRGEGIPLTPIEAMACAIPVIVGNQDGSQEAVDHERNGWVIDPFDLQKHSDILIQFSNDKLLQKAKKEEALKVVQERFSFETFKSKHQKVYSKWNNRS